MCAFAEAPAAPAVAPEAPAAVEAETKEAPGMLMTLRDLRI